MIAVLSLAAKNSTAFYRTADNNVIDKRERDQQL